MHRLELILLLLATLTCASIAGPRQVADKQLDFWIGEWVITDSTPNAKNPPGTNSIRRLYGGKVIHENFKMGTFEGQSWSVFNPRTKQWQQTWVDNSGGYIVMNSTTVDGNLAIQTLTRKAAPDSSNRMVFKNVKSDSFTWIWEATADGGKSWTLAWRLEYKRAKPPKGSLSRSIQKADALHSLMHSWT